MHAGYLRREARHVVIFGPFPDRASDTGLARGLPPPWTPAPRHRAGFRWMPAMARSPLRKDRTDDGKVTGRLDGKAATMRMSAVTRACVEVAAQEADLSIGAWMRTVIVQTCGAPPEEEMPTRPVETAIPVSVELTRVGELDRHVRRLNGAVVQLAKALHGLPADGLHAAVERELASMRDVQRAFTAYLKEVAQADDARLAAAAADRPDVGTPPCA
jgi:hypothetical protein